MTKVDGHGAGVLPRSQFLEVGDDGQVHLNTEYHLQQGGGSTERSRAEVAQSVPGALAGAGT